MSAPGDRAALEFASAKPHSRGQETEVSVPFASPSMTPEPGWDGAFQL